MMGTPNEALVKIGNRSYTISSDDDYLQHISAGFEPETVRLIEALATGGRNALDIGANIGCTALLLSQRCRHVHAFEPSPTTFRFLQKNVSRSGATNISIQNIGLGADSVESTLTFAPSLRAGGFI